MRSVIENKLILLCDLSSGELGEAESKILGGLLFGKLFWTAMALQRKNPTHYVFYDKAEAANELMAAALSQARKHFLVLTLANQYASQYEKTVLDSLSANASHKIVFRVSADDAEKLERVSSPK